MDGGWGKITVNGKEVRQKKIRFTKGRAMRADISHWGSAGLDSWAGHYDQSKLPIEAYVKDISFQGEGREILNVRNKPGKLGKDL